MNAPPGRILAAQKNSARYCSRFPTEGFVEVLVGQSASSTQEVGYEVIEKVCNGPRGLDKSSRSLASATCPGEGCRSSNVPWYQYLSAGQLPELGKYLSTTRRSAGANSRAGVLIGHCRRACHDVFVGSTVLNVSGAASCLNAATRVARGSGFGPPQGPARPSIRLMH